jgi:hypothetical protein
VSVTARLTGVHGTRRASLEVDGRTLESRPVTAAADGSATVAFAPLILSGGRTARGTVRLEEDALPADDAFHFALAPDPRIGAVVVRGPGAGDVFLERALSLGDAPGFRPTVRPPGTLRAADLAGDPVVILDQAPFPGGAVGERLQRHVEEGGGLIVVLGESAPRLPEAILPGRAAAPVDRSGVGGTTLGFVDFGHPVFAPFSTPRAGDFTAAHVYRYRPIDDAPGQRVLARFGDGATALAEQRVGRGRVLLWASTLDDRWNDLALQPVFLPFLHEVVKFAAGYAPAPTSRVVGDPWDPGASRPATAASLLLSPSGRRTEVEPSTPVTLEEPGFYQLRDRRTGAEGTTLAVNVDRSESRLESFDPAELVREVSPAPSAQTRAGGTLSLQERERSQSGWWYLVILAFLLLAAETVLSNRLPRATATLSNGRGAV